ncbi:hypothetical protein IJ135_00520, partial [Candidatus Saccharibacteria bacterium]|nr:hypothetical protein [Candidatus Saccharibacteria bacterium]
MENIRKSLKEAIAAAYGEDFAPEFSPAPANVAADYSSNAPLKLAKVLHLPPLQIAEELKVHVIKNGCSPAEISVTPHGFLNFISPSEYLSDIISGYAANLEANIASVENS